MVRAHGLVLLAGLVLVGVLAGLVAARPEGANPGAPRVTSLADGRDGLFRFTSYNAEWFEVATGEYRAKPVAVEARLRMPEGTHGPVPAVILVHGSAGLSAHEHSYAVMLARNGYATLVMDSFAARGVRDTVATPAAVTPWSMLVDAYRALALLQTHPRIDAARIAVVGWSKGGMIADWASRSRYRTSLHPPERPGFAAHAAFYPWCGEQQVPVVLTGAPILFLVGEDDDWTGAAPCRDYAARTAAAGFPVRLRVFAGAEHGFDQAGRFRRALPEAESWSRCNYLWTPLHFVVVESGETKPWDRYSEYVATCSQRGAHAGSNVHARREARSALQAFLADAFARTR